MKKEILKAFTNIKAKLEKYEPKDALNLIDFILLEHAINQQRVIIADEIVKELNKLYVELEWVFNKRKNGDMEFKAISPKNRIIRILFNGSVRKEIVYDIPNIILPLELARDITTFFTQQKETQNE